MIFIQWCIIIIIIRFTDPDVRNVFSDISPKNVFGLEAACSDSASSDHFELECSAEKLRQFVPEIGFVWKKDDVVFQVDSEIQFEENFRRHIHKVPQALSSDSGRYCCIPFIDISEADRVYYVSRCSNIEIKGSPFYACNLDTN